MTFMGLEQGKHARWRLALQQPASLLLLGS